MSIAAAPSAPQTPNSPTPYLRLVNSVTEVPSAVHDAATEERLAQRALHELEDHLWQARREGKLNQFLGQLPPEMRDDPDLQSVIERVQHPDAKVINIDNFTPRQRRKVVPEAETGNVTSLQQRLERQIEHDPELAAFANERVAANKGVMQKVLDELRSLGATVWETTTQTAQQIWDRLKNEWKEAPLWQKATLILLATGLGVWISFKGLAVANPALAEHVISLIADGYNITVEKVGALFPESLAQARQGTPYRV